MGEVVSHHCRVNSLRRRLLDLPVHDRERILSEEFYLERGFSAQDARDIGESWIELDLGGQADGVVESVLLHAWSILAVLGGKDGREWLITELAISDLDDAELLCLAFPDLMVASGREAIPDLIAELDDCRCSQDYLVEIANALAAFAARDIEKDTVLATLAGRLKGNPEQRALKGHIISHLMDLGSVSHLPEIRKAFEDNLVDVSIVGDFEEVEIDLGLRKERSEPAPSWPELEAKLAEKDLLERAGPSPEEGGDGGIILHYLKKYGGPMSFSSLAELDGFLLGVAAAPCEVSPEESRTVIWDRDDRDYSPDWESRKEEGLFNSAVLRWKNHIIRRLNEGSYTPIVEARSQLRVPTEEETDWARGLLSSILTWHSGEAEATEAHQALMAAALHLITPSDETPDAELIQLPHVAHAARLAYAEKESGHGTRREPGEIDEDDKGFVDFGGTVDPYRRDDPKISRNDPCPCGSGLKYKRCCMN